MPAPPAAPPAPAPKTPAAKPGGFFGGMFAGAPKPPSPNAPAAPAPAPVPKPVAAAPAPAPAPAPAAPSPFTRHPETGLVDRARVGVPAMSVPVSAAGIPRLPNLSDKQRAVEHRFASAYSADPHGMAAKYLAALRRGKVGVAPNVFATDDVKLLNPDYNPGGAKPGEPLDERTQKAMAKYNLAVHGTANAVAKRAFLMHLDELAKGPPERRTVLVTNGGVAAGKGSSLSHAVDPRSPYAGKLPAAHHVGAVWDAAGEQNATENEWVHREATKRGLTPIFAYVHAHPQATWDAPDRGVIRRAVRKGRMVDARLFADSYAEGAKNMHEFYQKHKDDGTHFIFLDNTRKGAPRALGEFPKEALQYNGEKIYADALDSLYGRAAELPKALVGGGMMGRQIWGPPRRTIT